MKLIKKINIIFTIATVILFIGCNNKEEVAKRTITSEQLSYRHSPLNDEMNTSLPELKYTDKVAGISHKIKRAFQDAPPMLPHSVKEMLPIQKDNNQCIICHVDSAPYDKTIPEVPISHMTNFRPIKSVALKGVNTSSQTLRNVSITKYDTLYQGRFNCTQCHAPQSNAKLLTPNLFEADYTSKDGEYKSTWDDRKFMENINTIR
jgi:cytochrome c-type protein NapB